MKSALEAWLASSRREPPRLEAALLAGRPWRVIARRLRMVAALRGLELAVHLVEFWLLVQVWSGSRLAGAVVGHGAAAIAGAAWWGCLEIVRAELRARGPQSALVGRWLRGALAGAAVVAGATGLGLAACAVRGRLGPFELYLGTLALRAAADAVLRAYQAGVQATRRIYRPLGAVAAVELGGLALLAVALPLVGRWSLPLAVAASTAASRAVSFHYARRAYRVARIEPPRLRERAPHPRVSPGALLWAALAGAGSRIGSMMVIALVAAGGARLGPAARALHLVTPLIALAASGCTTFYVDVVRLGRPLEQRLGARLSAALVPSALALALASWIAASVLLLIAGAGTRFAFSLLPLFAAQALFNLAGLELVARQRFREAAAVAALFALAAVSGAPAAIALASALAALVTWARSRSSAGGWIDELAAERGPVAVGRADLARGVAPARALAALEARLGARGRVALSGRRAIWFERGAAERLDRAGAAIATAGMASAIDLELHSSGAHALARTAGAAPDADQLCAEFAARFPDGVAIDLRARRAAVPDAAPLDEIWRDALVFARGGRPRRSDWAVSALVDAGSIAIVFAIPRRGPGAARTAWGERVRAAAVGEALAALHAPARKPTYLDEVVPAPHG